MSRKISWLVEWNVEFDPKDAVVALSRTFDNIDERVFQDPSWMKSFWNTTALEIGKIIDGRMKAGKGWKPLSPQYLEWKKRAVTKGYKVKAGEFGMRRVKFTQIGFLTDTLFKSATKRNEFANIFEVKDVPGWKGGAFRYAVDGKKLPYAKGFDKERPFFYLEEGEGHQIMKKLQLKILSKISAIYK